MGCPHALCKDSSHERGSSGYFKLLELVLLPHVCTSICQTCQHPVARGVNFPTARPARQSLFPEMNCSQASIWAEYCTLVRAGDDENTQEMSKVTSADTNSPCLSHNRFSWLPAMAVPHLPPDSHIKNTYSLPKTLRRPLNVPVG